MITVYKLTDTNGQTRNQTQWGEGISHTAPGNGAMCSLAYLHAYRHPLIAEFCNPIHSNFNKFKILWECESLEPEKDDGLKIGVTYLKTIKPIECPKITLNQRVFAAIQIARMNPNLPDTWNRWADNWIAGKDRSRESAAAEAARVASKAEAWVAEAAWAAKAAAKAAAAKAAEAEAAWAAWAAAAEAWVAWAAAAAEASKQHIPEFTQKFIAILEQAIKFEV